MSGHEGNDRSASGMITWQCYCGRSYTSAASLRRHRPDCVLSSEPHRDFLCLLACLGGLVPGDLFHRASTPAFCWNERGATARDNSCELPGFLTDSSALNEIIRAVQALRVVQLVQPPSSYRLDDGSPLWASCQFQMSPSLLEFIPRDLRPWTVDGETLLTTWKKTALKLLAHAFPIEDIDTKFFTRGPAYTPLLIRLISDNFVIESYGSSEECHRLALVCACASRFAGREDQYLMLSISHKLIIGTDNTPPSLAYRIQLHLQRTSQLFGGRPSIPLPPRPITHHINALEAEALLLRAQQDIDDGKVSRPWDYIHWKPLNAAQPSKLEDIAAIRLSLFTAKLHRLAGNFLCSYRILQLLIGQRPALPCQYLLRAKLQLTAVCGELGFWDEGRQVLQSMEGVLRNDSQMIRLSEAEFHLSRSLALVEGSQRDIGAFRDLLDSAMQESLDVKPKPLRRILLRCCVGLAILAHVRSRTGNHISLVDALNTWQTAKAACRLLPEQYFLELMCCSATAEVLLRLSDPTATAELEKAIEIRDRVDAAGAQNRFVIATLGTRWADLLNDWIEAHGRPRVLRPWQECVKPVPALAPASTE